MSDGTENTEQNTTSNEGDNKTHEGGGDGGQKPEKVAFSPEQQAKVQELIDGAYKRAYEKAGSGNSEVEKLQAEIEKLKANKEKKDSKKKEEGQPDEEWQKAFAEAEAERDNQIEELKSQLGQMNEEKKRSSILAAVSRHNVVDAEAVSQLIWNDVKVDENGNLMVQGESGQPRISKSGQPMTVDEYIGEWLEQKPYLLRSTNSQGAGSQGGKFGEAGGKKYDFSDPAIWRTMPKEDMDKALKEGVNVGLTSGQTFKFKSTTNPFLEARKRRFSSKE